MAAEARVDKLVLVHFRPGKVDKMATLTAMSKIYKVEIVFAEDMQGGPLEARVTASPRGLP